MSHTQDIATLEELADLNAEIDAKCAGGEA